MIQFYSTTLGGAIADNEPRSVNVHTATYDYDSVGRGLLLRRTALRVHRDSQQHLS